ncbi:DDE_Tnp_IS1595 domain-containing protein [Trichonephila clavipes]|nr:DDE_Tnp_IS1595 domain-containing protein [Trichonephila clavipes]
MSNSKATVGSSAAEYILPDVPPRSTQKTKKKRDIYKVLKQPRKSRRYAGMQADDLHKILTINVVEFCQNLKLLAPSVTCLCGEVMIISVFKESADGYMWTCPKNKENEHCSVQCIRKGTWFENSELSIPEILWIAYMWVHEYSFVSMLHECDLASEILNGRCTSCKDSCRLILECKRDPIGGPDKLVEIFECKYKGWEEPKKPHKSYKKFKNEKWVFCALEHFSTNTIFLIVKNKKADTVCEIFDQYFLPGTTIFTHIWNAYRNLSSENFDFLTNEKSLTFHDTNTKSDMDTIEEFIRIAERPRPGLNFWNKFEYDAKFCESFYRKSLAFAKDAYVSYLKDIARLYAPLDRVIKEQPPELDE